MRTLTPILTRYLINVSYEYPPISTSGLPMSYFPIKEFLHKRTQWVSEDRTPGYAQKIAYEDDRNFAKTAIIRNEEEFIQYD